MGLFFCLQFYLPQVNSFSFPVAADSKFIPLSPQLSLPFPPCSIFRIASLLLSKCDYLTVLRFILPGSRPLATSAFTSHLTVQEPPFSPFMAMCVLSVIQNLHSSLTYLLCLSPCLSPFIYP